MPTSAMKSRHNGFKAYFRLTPDQIAAQPLAHLHNFSKIVREDVIDLISFIKSGRCRATPEQKNDLLLEFSPRDAPFLAANNPEARIRFWAACRRALRDLAEDQPSALVTLAPAQYIMPLSKVETFPINRIRAWVRHEMREIDYFGIIEIAGYSSFPGIRKLSEALISFHVHLLTWNSREVRQRIHELNSRYPSAIPGMAAADCRPIDDLDGALCYLLKPPGAESRVFGEKRASVRPITEPAAAESAGVFRQWKRPAPPGFRIKLRSVQTHWHLDKVILAGGKGRCVLQTVRNDVLEKLSHSMRKGRQHQYSGFFEDTNLAPPQGWLRLLFGWYDATYVEMVELLESQIRDGLDYWA